MPPPLAALCWPEALAGGKAVHTELRSKPLVIHVFSHNSTSVGVILLFLLAVDCQREKEREETELITVIYH